MWYLFWIAAVAFSCGLAAYVTVRMEKHFDDE